MYILQSAIFYMHITMQNEHDVEFHILHTLTDELAVRDWLKLISQASREVQYPLWNSIPHSARMYHG